MISSNNCFLFFGFFWPFLFSRDPYNVILLDFAPRKVSSLSLIFFFILGLCLGESHCCVFQFTDLFYFIQSAVEP